MSGPTTTPRTIAVCLVVTCYTLVFESAAPTPALAACGDGVTESPLEQCDDGNIEAGDCCAADCRFEPQDTPCGLDDLCLKAGGAACDGQGECTLGDSMFCFGNSKADLFDPGEPEDQRVKMRGASWESIDTLGDPSAGTQYALCIYNYRGIGPLQVDYRLPLPVGDGWQRKGAAFVYRRPSTATTPLLRARIGMRSRRGEDSGPRSVRLVARGATLGLPGPVDSSRYFDAFEGISSVCVVNDLGATVGVSTWLIAKNRSFVNRPDYVHWAPPRLRD